MRSLLGRTVVVLGVAAAAVGMAVAPAQAEPATVTTVCTEFGTALLPDNAPPLKGGLITVVVRGEVVTTTYVPGPCNAPGFVQVQGG
jgi:hypothetical protein